MPVFDTSNITTTGLTVSGSTILSGNNASAILTVSGTAAALLTINDTVGSATLATFSRNDGTNILTITTAGTRINTFIIDSNNSTGTTGQFLSQTTNGTVWTGVTSTGGTTLQWYAENSTPPTVAPVATGLGAIVFGDNAKGLAPDMLVFGDSSGSGATNASGSTFIGVGAGSGGTNASGSTFLGPGAGNTAAFAFYSNFFGANAGAGATNANNSNFIGQSAGSVALNANNSNFMGVKAGSGGSNNSNYFGQNAGFGGSSAPNSNFFGQDAGNFATNAANSNFFGQGAGQNAGNATQSNFFGKSAGNAATNAANSNFIGFQAGIVVGASVGSNNTIIGTNISLPAGQANTFNIGGILFGANMFSANTGTASISAETVSKVGVGVLPNSIAETLHVSGTGLFNNTLKMGAGTTTTAPLQFVTGGVLTTAAIAGAMEVDSSGTNYYTYDIGARGVNKIEQMVVLTGTTPLVSSNSTQLRLFTGTTFSSGAFKVKANTAYMFECSFDLSGMSATLGTFSFGFSGTATVASIKYTAQTVKNVVASANNYTTFVTIRSLAPQVISSATTGTVGSAYINGIMRVTNGGFLAPVTTLSTAAAATVAQDSYFKISPIGDTKQVIVGAWV